MSPDQDPKKEASVIECVDVEVDHHNRLIDVTVHIDITYENFWDRETTDEDRKRMMDVLKERARVVKESLEASWNADGRRFKCYAVRFIVDVKSAGRGGFRENAVDVELVPRLKVDARRHAYIVGRQAAPEADPLSDNPIQRVRPLRGMGLGPAQWPMYNESSWAHELGHLLGLHDGYDALTEVPRGEEPNVLKGHPRDRMSRPQTGQITGEMITKLLRRTGKVDEREIKCPIRMRCGPSTFSALFFGELREFRIEIEAEDYKAPSSDPAEGVRVEFEGRASFVGHASQFSVTAGTAVGVTDQNNRFQEVPVLGVLTYPGILELEVHMGDKAPLRLYGKLVGWSADTGLPVVQEYLGSSEYLQAAVNQPDMLSLLVRPPLLPVFEHIEAP